MGWEWVPAHFPFPHPYVVFRVLNLTVFSISFSLSHSSEGNDLHRICEGNDLHWICEGNDLAAAISVGVTTVVLRRGFPPFSGRLVRRAYDALLLDAGGTLLQLVKPVEETYASIGRKYGFVVGVLLLLECCCCWSVAAVRNL
ncbi:unnamed protein product [Camellia sinensis]